MRDRAGRTGLILVFGPLLAALSVSAALGQASPEPGNPASPRIDFERAVRPLLASRCVACHGEKLQKAGLRLDRKREALEGGDSGPAILPGKSAESELIRRVTSAEPAKVMPPGGKRLSPEEVALLRGWIDAGAEWPEAADAPSTAPRSTHWAFQPVVRPPLPGVRNKGAVYNPIDAFILAKLEEKSLKPSPPADRVTLIRRVSLDLTGLPPTPEEVDAFLKDTAPGAYERVVDRLLASPHYGERWGRHWLDQARYADSNGYTIDSARSMWPYRDWVIHALNRDLPFDRFAIEQLAGDLLPNADRQQVVATGFHRNTLFNEEGGTDREQFRVESVMDRVDTTGAVFLGLTVGCARCHTHKYDPITQKEYYRLYAFFNNADEPALPLPTPDQAREQEALRARLAAAQKRLADYDRTIAQRQAAWEARLSGAAGDEWKVLRAAEARSEGGAQLRALPDGSLLVEGTAPDTDTYTVVAEAPAEAITAVRLEALTHESIPGGGPGLTPHGNFVLSEFEAAALARDAGASVRPLRFSGAVADHAQANMPVTAAIDGDPKTGWGVYLAAGKGNPHVDRTAVFYLKEPLQPEAGGRLTFSLKQLYTNPRYQIGRFRLSITSLPKEALTASVAPEVQEILRTPAEKRSAAQKERLAEEFRKTDPRRAELTAEVTRLQAEEKNLAKAVPSALVIKEREQPRESYVMIRGDFLRRGAPVTPGVPAVLPALSATSGAPTRVDLARWLVDPKNPLTPRVTVNRVWQQYFGTGLVETENDFGVQGTPPSHPELLDWLASWFVSGEAGNRGERRESGRPTLSPLSSPLSPPGASWSLKALHRLIVTSATYRQSSQARADLAAADPANRLLGRQSRLRLDAEVVRDTALAASGLLSRKIGGPSVFPPQPAGVDLFTQSKKNWKASEGEDRYRRGMYTFFWRSSPYPLFTTFDAPGANVTCTRRVRSNTPLQALMLANDQSLFEMAQGLAARVLKEAPAGEEERLRHAFRRCLGREPGAVEAHRLLTYYRSQVQAYGGSPKDAESVAPRERPDGVSPAEGAAWTSVARVLMNLDEFITRE